MRLALAGLVAALVGSPAVACVNDVELPTHEREFWSHSPSSRSRLWTNRRR